VPDLYFWVVVTLVLEIVDGRLISMVAEDSVRTPWHAELGRQQCAVIFLERGTLALEMCGSSLDKRLLVLFCRYASACDH